MAGRETAGRATAASDTVSDDEGFSTVAGAGVIAGLAILLVAALYLGSAAVARHRAQSAADLVALAGASALLSGSGDGCDEARRLAAKQEGAPRVVDCAVDGDDIQVRVAVSVRLGRFGMHDARAAARAGPVEAGTS